VSVPLASVSGSLSLSAGSSATHTAMYISLSMVLFGSMSWSFP
jgi:hypothetical protein